MNTLTVMPFLLAMFAAVAAMPTNVYQVCAWNAGTLEIEPCRRRTSAAVRGIVSRLRTWCAALWGPRLGLACVGLVLLCLLVGQLGAGHAGLLLAVGPIAAVDTLQAQRAQLLREADALQGGQGAFKDDATRAAFDAKMTEVAAIDVKIREASPAAPVPAPATTPTADQVRAEAIAAERTRAVGIQDAVRVAKLPVAFSDDLVKSGVSLEEARTRIFAKMAETSNEHPTRGTIGVGEDALDKWLRGATNWLLMKGGTNDLVARATKTDVVSLDPGEFRGLTLLDLAKQTLERAGRSVRGLDKMALVAEAMTVRGNITQSTSDFAVLLENVMHKVLQAAYSIQPDTWRRFSATGTVTDFRAHNRYRMGTFGALDAVGQNGEFKNKSISDAEKASITASTKGNIITVSRQMIVNDDMSAFSRLLQLLGRAAALSIEVDVYALLAQNAGLGPALSDGNTLFHAAHNNIGGGVALSAAAIDSDRVLMAKQKDKDGNEFLDLRPSILVVPVGLGGLAKIINQSLYDPDTVANKAQMKPNVVVGLFRDVVDTPRLAGTRRYLFADPGIAPTIEVAFLEGQSSPVLESQDGWRTDGAEMKVRFDYGVAAVDFRGATTDAGV